MMERTNDLPTPSALAKQDRTVTYRPGQDVAWTADGVERLVYHYATDRHKAYIHPLRTAGGETLTYFEPWDHTWPRAVWFAWKYINGVNFWEESPDRQHDGRTVFAGVERVLSDPHETVVTTRYTYQLPGGEILLREQRTVRVALPSDGSCVIDWDAHFTAAEHHAHLDCTPADIDETRWGGYAGLAFRASEGWSAVAGLDSEGRQGKEIHHKRARWACISGCDAHGRRASVALLDHPFNPRSPTHWYYWDDPGFVYLNPTLLVPGPYDLAPGADLHLRYRILTLDGSPNPRTLEQHYAAYAATGDAATAAQPQHERTAAQTREDT